MQRYGYHRRPFLDATSFLVLVVVVAIRGLGPANVPWRLDFAAPSVAFAEELGSPESGRVSSSAPPLPVTSLPEQAQFGRRIDTRVEVLWASESPRRWAGSITWSGGSESSNDQSPAAVTELGSGVGQPAPKITAPVLIASSPILSGGVFETAAGGIVFGPPSRLTMIPSGEGKLTPVETRSGGISFRVRGNLDDRATLRLDGDDINSGFTVSFTIGDLVAGNAIDAKINDRASVAIRRVAAGDLRVRLGETATIFWAEQTVDIALINPMSLPIPKSATALVLDCLTYSAADDSLVSSISFPVTATAGELHCPKARWVSPATNGAYRVRFRLRDTSVDRGWLSTALSPTTIANSITRSITTTLPQSLTTPLSIPLVPFNSPATVPESQAQGGKIASSSSSPSPMSSLNWQLTHEPVAIAESTISIAVVAASREIPFLGASTEGNDSKSTDHAADSAGWTQLGNAVVRNESSTVSRLFIQPTTQWLGGTAGGNRVATSIVHAGQRLNLIESSQQLELSIPVSKVGVRHRAVIRVPSQSSLRLVAELVDLDRATGVPQPLGPGLAIIRSVHQATAQASGVDPVGVHESELWHEAVIDFWPRSAATRLVLSNRSTTSSAGIGRVDVMVNESSVLRYPLAKQNRRSTGDARLTAMRLEISDFFEQFGDRGLPTAGRPLDYQQVWVAANRLIETLHREGYGGVILTVSSDGISLFPDRSIVADTAWNANWAGDAGPIDPLRLMLRMFERESLQLIPCIRPSAPVLALEQKIRSDASAVSITTRSPLVGQLGAWSFDGPSLTAFPIYNGGNEVVFSELKRSLLELNEQCRDSGCVPALGLLADERSYLRSPPLPLADEQTLNDFHTSLGENAPARETLEVWIQKSGETAFQRWRAERLASGFQQILNQIEGRNLLMMSCDSALPSNLVELGRDGRILTTRLQRRALTEPLAMRIRDEACNASVPVSMEGGPPTQAYLAAVFHQPVSDARAFEPGFYPTDNLIGADDLDLDALTPVNVSEIQTQPGVTALLDPTESSLAFAHLVNRSDRSMVAIGGGGVNQPASEVRRRSLRSFAELPPVVMFDVESNDSGRASLRVRMATYNDETYIYAVNQTRWPVVWEAILSRPATVHRLGPPPPQRSVALGIPLSDDPLRVAAQSQSSTGDSIASRRPRESGTRWQTIVDGGELVAIRISSREAKLADWRATFAGSPSQIATIRAGVEDAVSSIAVKQHLRRRDLISNASFEAEGVGVPGWMIAQYPTDCVAIDSSVAFHGSRSIRLTGQPGRAGGSWIVSQKIAPPRSGRLALSVRFRGGKAKEQKKDDDATEPIVVRMALEGTVGGTPIRKAKSVTLEADGRWSEPQWLEIAKLPSLPLESLRLTIDLMSAGEVWVDDIACYDQFMTAAEKTHWEHLLFLAAGGLSRGDCVGASRLFDSHWALDLVNPSLTSNGQSAAGLPVRHAAYNPSVSGGTVKSSAVSPVPAEQNSPPKIKQPVPRAGWSDRLKSWLPRPLRFGS